MVNDYILDKVSGKIKETIGIGKFDDTKILIDTFACISIKTWHSSKSLRYFDLKNYVWKLDVAQNLFPCLIFETFCSNTLKSKIWLFFLCIIYRKY